MQVSSCKQPSGKRKRTLASARDAKMRKKLDQDFRSGKQEGIVKNWIQELKLVIIYYNDAFPSTSIELIDLTNQTSVVKPTVYWLTDLKLYPEDEKCLHDGKWLTDNIIDAAQTLLKETYPHVHGLEPVALAETLSFSVQSGEFVQILNISRCHWVTISNIGCKPGHINIYDSLPNCSVPT